MDQATVEKYTLGRVLNEVKTNTQDLANQDMEFAKSQGKDVEWLAKQMEALEKTPSEVTPIAKQYILLTEQKRKNTISDSIMVNDVRKKIEDEKGNISQYIPKDAPTLRYRDSGTGKEYIYSPREFVDFNEKVTKYRKQTGSSGTGGPLGGNSSVQEYIDYPEARKEMSDKELHLLDIIAGKTEAKDGNKTLLQAMRYYKENVNNPYAVKLREIDEATAKEVTNRLSYNQGFSVVLPTRNQAEKSFWAGQLTNIARLAETPGGIAYSPNADPDVMRKLAQEDASYTYTTSEPTTDGRQAPRYTLHVSGEAGNVDINITSEQKQKMFGNQFDSSPQIQAVQPYLEQLRKMGGTSTALSGGKSTEKNAYLNYRDFPNANVFGVKGNIVTIPGTDVYTIKLNIYDPETGTWSTTLDYPRTGMIPADKLQGALGSLTDAEIYKILHESPATTQDLKRIQEAAKKPK